MISLMPNVVRYNENGVLSGFVDKRKTHMHDDLKNKYYII